jgi:NAD(P)-dependent dehydrogenase (short-subunit alcohol dehydrogenase family)
MRLNKVVLVTAASRLGAASARRFYEDARGDYSAPR